MTISEIRLKRFLLLLLSSNSSSTDLQLALSLKTHDTTTPLLLNLGVSVAGVLASSKSSFILRVHTGQAHASGSLLVDEGTELSLAGDDGVSNTHLVAESREPHDEFEGIDIVGNQNELSLLLLDELGDVVQTVADEVGSTLLLNGLAFHFSLGLLSETSLLLGSSLGDILGEETEDISGYTSTQSSIPTGILLESVVELVHSGRNLQTLGEDLALSLEENVTRPFDVSGDIHLRLQNQQTMVQFVPKHHHQYGSSWEWQRRWD